MIKRSDRRFTAASALLLARAAAARSGEKAAYAYDASVVMIFLGVFFFDSRLLIFLVFLAFVVGLLAVTSPRESKPY